MMFRNRMEAADLIAKNLAPYRDKNALVLAIPRGAVPMAKAVADRLHADLDVVLVHKLGHPMNQEYAIGAVDEAGRVYLDEVEYGLEVDSSYVNIEKEKQLGVLQNRRQMYTPIRRRIDPRGRTVIIIDDGIATGWTLKAAIAAIRHEKPKKIIAATAVAASDSLEEIKTIADEVVCLHAPSQFHAVSEFFHDFEQVSDEEVVEILSGQGETA